MEPERKSRGVSRLPVPAVVERVPAGKRWETDMAGPLGKGGRKIAPWI